MPESEPLKAYKLVEVITQNLPRVQIARSQPLSSLYVCEQACREILFRRPVALQER